MLMGTSLWFEGHQDRGLETWQGKGLGDDFFYDRRYYDGGQTDFLRRFGEGKYFGGLLLIFIHRFTGLFV
jgi:hypothetical protein